jgi:hypothetical protein
MDTRCRLGCLHQQEAQQRIALLADVTQSLFASTGVSGTSSPNSRSVSAPFVLGNTEREKCHHYERNARCH